MRKIPDKDWNENQWKQVLWNDELKFKLLVPIVDNMYEKGLVRGTIMSAATFSETQRGVCNGLGLHLARSAGRIVRIDGILNAEK